MLSVERQKFEDTLKRGSALVLRMAQDLKAKGKHRIPAEILVELYDSHGLPPEAVRESVAKENVDVKVPEDFYRMVAERHLQAPPKEVVADERLDWVADLPETRMLYYEDPYQTTCESRVLRVLDTNQVVLDETVFFPEGGGQPADLGVLEFNGKESKVVDVQKVGKVIIHVLKGSVPKAGDKTVGRIDWERRRYLMRAHTATHLVMGAARRVLGQHVWQTGTQKGVEQTRLDITHYKRLTPEEIYKIEVLANHAVTSMIPVEIQWLPRDEAEARYGFRLYQGGAIPGKDIRVVRAGDWEVEACAGTHVRNTGQVGFIKIVSTERIQDGVERLVYSTGRYAVEANQDKEKLLQKLSETLDAPVEKLLPTTQRLLKEWKEVRGENKRLIEELSSLESGDALGQAATTKEFNDVKFVTQEFTPINIERMIKTAGKLTEKEETGVVLFYGKDEKTARFIILAGKAAVKKGVDASEIAKETARLLGGGGSGRPEFAQGGGTKINKIGDAVIKAEDVLKKQLKKNTKIDKSTQA
jgi:alanyl-tRNA synthetase